eukprot:894714-Prymnesium_polylepis.1
MKCASLPKKLAPSCPQHRSPVLLSLRRVPCTLHTSVARLSAPASHEKPALSHPRHYSRMLLSPSAMHAPHEPDSLQVRQPRARSQRPDALSAAASCCCRRAECHA